MELATLSPNFLSLPHPEDILPERKPGYFTQTIGELFGFEISPDLTAWQTLQAMEKVARNSAALPSVSYLASDLASNHNSVNAVLSIYKWVRRHMPFREDPWIIYNGKLKKTERIYEPWKALELIEQNGSCPGDCDDMATLLVSLLRAIGYRAGFIAVETGNEGPRLDHVFAYGQLGRMCLTCDPASTKKDWSGHRLWKHEVY